MKSNVSYNMSYVDAEHVEHVEHAEHAKLLPVFTDRASFVRSAGLNGGNQLSVVIVNRQGEVLARVNGAFDPEKAQTLRAQGFQSSGAEVPSVK